MSKLDRIVDVMNVPADGDPLAAVVTVPANAPVRELACDILVAGGGMGGVAAAWAAVRQGRTVCLIEETDWIGGQITSQGVAALDEHDHIETFGGTRAYYQLRESLRDHYRPLARPDVLREPLNPGDCWVTRLAFEPAVAHRVLHAFLEPYVKRGLLTIHLRTKAVAAEVDGDRVISVAAMNLDDRSLTRFQFRYLLDATELGDLLPLTGTEYTIGAESIQQTGEPHAQPAEPKAHCVQSCTYTFAMERRPAGESHRIAKPAKYEHYRDTQPYSLRIHVHGGEIYGETSGWLQYALFDQLPGTKGGLWTYRRLIRADAFAADQFPHDITMFNWPGNDYRDVPLVDRSPEDFARALQDAKRVSLGFAYWLQTDAPHLRIRPDVMDSRDGLSKHPYIREGRRILALKTIVEQDVAVAQQPGPWAAHFDDSVGVGWYPIDIHQAGKDDVGISTRTRPFQIPLGALIPRRMTNLIACNKNIGTTHITNGCYRLHPVEWNIGESAGLLAAMAVMDDVSPRRIHGDRGTLRSYQRRLLAEGVPLVWDLATPLSHPDFAETQLRQMQEQQTDADDV